MKKNILPLSLLICLLFLGTTHLSSQTNNRYWKDGQVYFKINDNILVNIDYNDDLVNPKTLSFISQEISKKYGITKITAPFKDCSSEALRRTLKIEFTNITEIRSILADLNNIYEIEYAEPGALYYSFISPPNDTYYNTTAVDHDFNLLWHLDLINAEQAWTLSEGSEDIKVAVLDNAVWAEHPDLINKIHLQKDLADNKDSSSPPAAEYMWSHGTHCAGLIAAENNNDLGIASIGNKIKLIAVKLAYDESSGDGMANGFEAIVWAADNGADVISMSWGGPMFFQTMQNAVNYAYNKGCTLLAAAGNNGDGGESEAYPEIPVNEVNFPAGLTHVIAVGSCDINDNKSAFSNYGTWIDLLSPGGFAYQGSFLGLGAYSILSTTYNDCGNILQSITGQTGGAESFGVQGKYDIMPGTSMATPVCAGLSGLVLSANKNLTPDKLTQILKSSCKNVSAQNTQIADSIGAGRIDAFAAVSKAINEISPIVANFEASDIKISVGGTINFTDKSIGNPNSWIWEFEGGTPAQSSEQSPQNISYSSDGLYKVTLTVSDGNITDTETKTALILVGKNPNAPQTAWIEQNINFEKMLAVHKIDIVNENIAWATSLDLYSEYPSDEFAITSDAGENWTAKKFSLSDDFKYISLSATSAEKAWVCAIKDGQTPKGAIFTTSDAGNTWTRQALSAFSNSASRATFIKMFNDNQGVCIGEPIDGVLEIYNTQDGGNTWSKNPNTVSTSSDESINSGVMYTLNDNIWFTSNKGKIYSSSDKGINWTNMNAPDEETSSLSFADNNNAVAISYKTETSLYGTTTIKDWKMSKSSDGGQTWTTISEDNSHISSVSAVPQTPGLLIATNFSITLNMCNSAYSNDWGETWTELDDSIIYTCVSMYNKNVGFAGGINESNVEGGIYKWKPLDPTNIPFLSIDDDIKIFPNPANNMISLVNCENSRYQILDLSGKLLNTGEIDSNLKTIDISNIPPGYFLIKIINKEYTKSFKISKLK